MDDGDPDTAAEEFGFLDGPILVEIEHWDWNFHVGLSTDLTPEEHRFQGGLNYTRGLQVDGQILAPQGGRNKKVRVWLQPFGPDLLFGPNDMDEVGQIKVVPVQPGKPECTATLLFPEGALPTIATCLNCVSKYLHIRTFDIRDDGASVRSFSFSATLPASSQL
jgi:hypothetical protein